MERIKEEVEDENFLAISIYPEKNDKNNKSDPIGLINEAIQSKSDFDEIYVVYDKDGYTKHKEAYDLLAGHRDKIHLVFSSISFETWILLHFERCSNDYSKSQDIIEQKLVGGPIHLSTYEKRGAFDLFPLIKDYTNQALINAAWLRHVQRIPINENPFYEINPYTDVDFLVKRLFEIPNNYFFIGKGHSIKLNSINISLLNEEDQLSIIIVNEKPISFTTNEISFYSDDEFENKIEINSSILNPNQSINLYFDNVVAMKFESNFIFFDLI